MARSSTGTFAGALACALGGTGPRRRRRAVAALLGIVGVLGCGTDYVASAGPADPSQLLASVVLDHHAIVLSTTAPWNTIQLTTTPMSGAGAPLAGLPAATYSLSDSGSVAVSADGTVSALAPASGVLVIASVSAGNSTRKDTAYVTVVDTPTPPVLATFSIQPLPGDSAKMPAADVFQFFNHKQLTV